MDKNLNFLTDLVKNMYFQGHSPATSGNYSYFNRDNNVIYISESSRDKEFFDMNCWLQMNPKGELLEHFKKRKSSAETDLHLAVYQNTDAGCVLHSHHLAFLALDLGHQKEIIFQGQEILKAINGIHTHEVELVLPIFENTQDIKTLSQNLFANYALTKSFAFLIKDHGLTVWGKTVQEAKRHLEAYVYLFMNEKNKGKLK